MMSQPDAVDIKALIIQEDDGWWSAQCLDYDIAVQAKNLSELSYQLEKTLMAYVIIGEQSGGAPFAGFDRAPQEFWDMYEESGVEVCVRKTQLQIESSGQRPIPRQLFRVAETHAP